MEQLTRFLQSSPTPWHAVVHMERMLSDRGFSVLSEESVWSLRPGGRYIIRRQPGALIAFIIPPETPSSQPDDLPRIHLACAHTDSPGLNLKPIPCKRKAGNLVLDVEVYGSPLLSTWFDRDLGLAGHVTLIGPDGGLRQHLIDFGEPVAILPSLAIHLNREANEGYKIRKHEDLSPMLLHPFFARDQDPSTAFRNGILQYLGTRHPGEAIQGWEPISWDLSLYDVVGPQYMGGTKGWVTGGRLDNLLSCFAAVTALADATTETNPEAPILPMLACFNHEESGSLSHVGAQSNFLSSVLKRLLHLPGRFERTLSRSLMISVDAAHGVHPNFADKHDGNNAPILNAGVVFKRNANQRYAHSVVAEGMLKGLCRARAIPWQEFAMRADMPCGSTIGPMLSAKLGLHAVDLGIASWAMHSIRETAGLNDLNHLQSLLTGFFSSP